MSDAEHMQHGIAIIGMSGRFPGAEDLAQFWENLRAGRESITFYDEEELIEAGVHPQAIRRPGYVRAHGQLAEIELFDAAFFGYTPREAEIIDPQQRLFLECAWEALEQAGYSSKIFDGTIGVYAGADQSTYLLNNLQSHAQRLSTMDELLVTTGNDREYLTTRVSYKLNLTGPSIAIHTTCSTALVAIHMACQSLLHYECDLMLAGGVSIRVPQKAGYIYREGSTLSPDGHCRAFDAQAQGAVPGNGIGVVALRRLNDALEARDTIHAVILGSAVNNDGALRLSYTAPGTQGQAAVIQEALSVADIDPTTIGYIETQGTGVPMADAIEIAALDRAFKTFTKQTGFCAIGSVKTNIGHLNVASGMAGLFKAMLALQHRQIPPTLHFERPHPNLNLDETAFYVGAQLADWPAARGSRRAGVSAFGLGGTNAHLVLEEAPAPTSAPSTRAWHALPLSARSDYALQQIQINLSAHLGQHGELDLADVAYTLQVGREQFSYRRTIIARDAQEAIQALSNPAPAARPASERPPAITFVFPHEAVMRPSLACARACAEPLLETYIDACVALIEPALRPSVRALLGLSDDQTTIGDEMLACAESLALFTITYSLARLCMQLGIAPSALSGQGVGEYAAACIGGVFELADGLALAGLYARLCSAATRLGGTPAPDELIHRLGVTRLQVCRRPIFSGHMQGWATPDELATATYWVEHLRAGPGQPGAIPAPLAQPGSQLLVLGAHGAPQKQAAQRTMLDEQMLFALPDAGELPDAARHFSTLLGTLWGQGVSIHWPALYAQEERWRVPLPTYPFERQRFWIAPLDTQTHQAAETGAIVEAATIPEATAEQLYPRPNLPNPYVAPRSALERQLADIWQNVLGIAQIGMQDNLFDLGADSLLILQITGQAIQIGIQLGSEMLYEYQTIEELSAVLEQ